MLVATDGSHTILWPCRFAAPAEVQVHVELAGEAWHGEILIMNPLQGMARIQYGIGVHERTLDKAGRFGSSERPATSKINVTSLDIGAASQHYPRVLFMTRGGFQDQKPG
jgi:hypothetical protein